MSGIRTKDYKIEAKDFKSIVWDWAIKLKVEPKEVHLRPMKTKWASLSEKGRLTFNSELLEKQRNLIDYVVVHELIHMKVPNHGKLFKSLIFVFLPDWEKCSEQLTEAA
jgi:predicted metal-dependent hydrolase